MKIEQWILNEVNNAKPCSIKYEAGQDFCDVSFKDLLWVENKCPELVKKLNLPYPLWCYSTRGDGGFYIYEFEFYGYGDIGGDGIGYGDGDGKSYGHGDLYGYDGYGMGDSYGYGYAYGDIYGYGDGYGSGHGNGYGLDDVHGLYLKLIMEEFLNGEIK